MSQYGPSGLKIGMANIAQQLNQRANSGGGGPGLIGGLTGANLLRGGIKLNPDGTVGSIEPMAPQHHILDAIFNHGHAADMANEQNAKQGMAALQTTQAKTLTSQQAEIAKQQATQQAAILQERANRAVYSQIATENNVAAFDPVTGEPTAEAKAALQQLPPEALALKMQDAKNKMAALQDPSVKGSYSDSVRAQNEAQTAVNQHNASITTPAGGTSALMDGLNPNKQLATVTGGSTAQQSTTKQKVAQYGNVPVPLGPETQESSVQTPGSVSPVIPVPPSALPASTTPSVPLNPTDAVKPKASPLARALQAGIKGVTDAFNKPQQAPPPIDNSLLAAAMQSANQQPQQRTGNIIGNLALNPSDLPAVQQQGQDTNGVPAGALQIFRLKQMLGFQP